MRIGLIAPPWAPVPPHLYGGIELVVDRLAQGFAAAGHEVVLFATGDSTCPVERRWLLEEAEGRRIGFTVPEVRHVLAAYEALNDGDYLLFLGRLSPDKGAGRAIEAARKADVPLLLAGKMREPWERDYFEARVAPFLSDEIQYLGEVGHERKLELLAAARGLVFPIRWNEPFGLVMIEAQACGTPVLAFPEGAAPEVVQHGRTGFLCEDEAEMAETVPKLEELDRAACRAAVETYFSTERMINEHLELYEELLS